MQNLKLLLLTTLVFLALSQNSSTKKDTLTGTSTKTGNSRRTTVKEYLIPLQKRYEQICHINNIYPKSITLKDGSVLLLSSALSGKASLMSVYTEDDHINYSNIKFDDAFTENAELTQVNSKEEKNNKYYFIHPDENTEKGIQFGDKFAEAVTASISQSSYLKSSMTSLKNGFVAVGAIDKIADNDGKYTASLYIRKPSTGSMVQGTTFAGYSKFISCFESGDGEIYCAYVGYEDPFISKLKIRHYSFSCGVKTITSVKNVTTTSTVDVTTTAQGTPVTKDKISYDLLYIIDSTGSMGNTLKAVQTYCIEIANKLAKELADYDFKFGIIFYKDDVKTKTKALTYKDFTNNMNDFQKFAKSASASGGGGDGPEDWVSAYTQAENLTWRDGIKMIVHIGDYGAHGTGYSNDKAFAAEGPKLDDLVQKFCDMDNLYIKGFKILAGAGNSFKRMNDVCIDHRKKLVEEKKWNKSDKSIESFLDMKDFDQDKQGTEEFVEMIVTSTKEVVETVQIETTTTVEESCTLDFKDEQVIKTFNTQFNYLKAIPVAEKEFAILFQAGKHETKLRNYGDGGSNLYYYRLRIEESGYINALRYEYLYNNCLYYPNKDSYNDDIAVLSVNKIMAVCETNEKKLHGFIIYKDKEEFVHFDFDGEKMSHPVYSKFGQSMGIFYNKEEKDSALQLINYPYCEDFPQNVIVPKYLNKTIDLTTSIYFLNAYPIIREEQVYFRWKSISAKLDVKEDGKSISTTTTNLPGKYTINAGNEHGIHLMEYTAHIVDSLDGEIKGRTCQLKVEIPECFSNCWSCFKKGDEAHNYCIGDKCPEGFFKKEDPSTEMTEFGKPFNCIECDESCRSCNMGPEGVWPDKKTNCIYCNNDLGFYYVEEDRTLCLNEEQIRQREKIVDNAYFLYVDITKKETYWKRCHHNCGSCSQPFTLEDNKCDTCRVNYHFFYDEKIPGTCYTGYEDKGFYVNGTDDKYYPCLKHCRRCKGPDYCDKCFDNWFLSEDKRQCGDTCPFYLAYDKNLWECVNCKNRYEVDTPRYNHKQICYYPLPEGYHVINDTYNLITICDPEKRCFTCEEEGTAKCTQCYPDKYKEHFLDNRTVFNCYFYDECAEDGVPDDKEEPKLCRNCKLGKKWRALDKLECIAPKPNRTYEKNETYGSLGPCYKSCETCWGEGSVEDHNCITCKEPDKYEINKDEDGHKFCERIVILPCRGELYYHDYDAAEDVCVGAPVCPPEYPYKMVQTRECIQYCRFENFFNNICSLSDISGVYRYLNNPFNLFNASLSVTGTYFASIITKVFASLSINITSSLKIDVNTINSYISGGYIGAGKPYPIPSSKTVTSNDSLYAIDFSSLGLQKQILDNKETNIENLNKHIITTTNVTAAKTAVELCECEKTLKEYYHLSSDEDLMLIKGNVLRDDLLTYAATQVEYIVFSTSLGKKLDLSLCKIKEDLIKIYQAFDSMKIGYCGKCAAGKRRTEESALTGEKIDQIVDQGYDPFDTDGSFFTDVCSTFTSEFGSDVLIEDRRTDYFDEKLTLCEEGCTYKGYLVNSKMYTCECKIKDVIDEKQSTQLKFIPLQKSENFQKPVRSSNIAVIKCGKQVFSSEGQKSNIGSILLLIAFAGFIAVAVLFFIRGANMQAQLVKNEEKTAQVVTNKNDDESEERKKKEDDDKLTNVNEYYTNVREFKEVQDDDKRSFAQIYLSIVKNKQIILFTFVSKKDYNSILVKIALFILFICFLFAFNALFFTDSLIRSIYQLKGNSNAAIFIPSLIFSSIICLIFTAAVRFVCLSEKDLLEAKFSGKKDAVEGVLKKLKCRQTILFAVSGALIFFFWYYVAAFCAIFKNSQTRYLINVIISFIICNAFPFLYCILPAALRKKAIDTHSEKLYKASQILAII